MTGMNLPTEPSWTVHVGGKTFLCILWAGGALELKERDESVSPARWKPGVLATPNRDNPIPFQRTAVSGR